MADLGERFHIFSQDIAYSASGIGLILHYIILHCLAYPVSICHHTNIFENVQASLQVLLGTLRPLTLNSKSGNARYVGELFQVAKAAKEGVVLNARNVDYLEEVAKEKETHLIEDQTETLGILEAVEQVR